MNPVFDVPRQTSDDARTALRKLKRAAASTNIRVWVKAEGDSIRPQWIEIPRAALDLLLEVLTHLARRTSIAILPMEMELSTARAASFLSVSRPVLVGLLKAGKIPFRTLGSHRRVRVADLVAYRNREA